MDQHRLQQLKLAGFVHELAVVVWFVLMTKLLVEVVVVVANKGFCKFFSGCHAVTAGDHEEFVGNNQPESLPVAGFAVALEPVSVDLAIVPAQFDEISEAVSQRTASG